MQSIWILILLNLYSSLHALITLNIGKGTSKHNFSFHENSKATPPSFLGGWGWGMGMVTGLKCEWKNDSVVLFVTYFFSKLNSVFSIIAYEYENKMQIPAPSLWWSALLSPTLARNCSVFKGLSLLRQKCLLEVITFSAQMVNSHSL